MHGQPLTVPHRPPPPATPSAYSNRWSGQQRAPPCATLRLSTPHHSLDVPLVLIMFLKLSEMFDIARVDPSPLPSP